MEIGPKIANLLRDIARARGLSVEEVLVEALLLYQDSPERSGEPDIGRPIRRVRVRVPESRKVGQGDGFLALLDRMNDRFELDEDEAMRLAVEEQHAFRRERASREEAER